MKTRQVAAFAFLVSALALVSCSDNPGVRLRYQAEKMYFSAERMARAVQIRPELANSEAIGQLRNTYGQVVQFCYGALDSIPVTAYPTEHQELTELAFRSSSRLAQLFYIENRYDTCISIFERLLHKTSVRGASLANTYLNLGRALQAAGKWDSALTVYEYTSETFYPPIDQSGRVMRNLYDLPVQLYGVYDRAGDPSRATLYLTQAEAYYTELINEFPNTELALSARASLTGLYEDTQRWEEAVTQLSLMRDSVGVVPMRARQQIADINARQLGRGDAALLQYDSILTDLKGSDTLARPLILLKKALVLLDRKRPAEARAALLDIKYNYSRFYDGSPIVQGSIARSFEDEGNWERADTEYRYLIEKYDGTEQAMSTCLYLAAKYAELKRNTEAQRMEQRAEADFDRIAANRAGTLLEASALGHKAELYRRRKDWPKTAELLCQIFDKFPHSEIGYQSLVGASVVYREKLNNPKAADSLLQELKKRLTVVDEPDRN
jgi:tetratricopeptide (TPR) repeat protein